MEMKNRVVRADDLLWGFVKSSASRAGLSASRWVRSVLYREPNESLCVICGEQATFLGHVNLGGFGDATMDDWIQSLKDGGGRRISSPFQITWRACSEHDDAIADYFMDANLNAIGGWSLASDPGGSYSRSGVNPDTDEAYLRTAEIMHRAASKLGK